MHGQARRTPRLTKLQLQWLLRTISTKTPEQLQFPFALWTREIVRALIKRRWGITLGLSSITRVLRKLGLTPQKPMARAIERDPIAVRHWIKEEFPEIKALARKVAPRYSSKTSRACAPTTTQARPGRRKA